MVNQKEVGLMSQVGERGRDMGGSPLDVEGCLLVGGLAVRDAG